MPAARYSDEFKTQVVREVIEKERTISSVAASYDLVAQTVGNWVARYKKVRFSWCFVLGAWLLRVSLWCF